MFATYIWMDMIAVRLRSMVQCMDYKATKLEDLPKISDNDVQIRPIKMYRDPFKIGDNILVMCEVCFIVDNETMAEARSVSDLARHYYRWESPIQTTMYLFIDIHNIQRRRQLALSPCGKCLVLSHFTRKNLLYILVYIVSAPNLGFWYTLSAKAILMIFSNQIIGSILRIL